MVNKKNEFQEDILDKLTPIVEAISPIISTIHEKQAPVIRRAQWMNFSIMLIICIGVIVLASLRIIDSSAATGLLGAIIGYVFGFLYSNKQK